MSNGDPITEDEAAKAKAEAAKAEESLRGKLEQPGAKFAYGAFSSRELEQASSGLPQFWGEGIRV